MSVASDVCSTSVEHDNHTNWISSIHISYLASWIRVFGWNENVTTMTIVFIDKILHNESISGLNPHSPFSFIAIQQTFVLVVYFCLPDGRSKIMMGRGIFVSNFMFKLNNFQKNYANRYWTHCIIFFICENVFSSFIVSVALLAFLGYHTFGYTSGPIVICELRQMLTCQRLSSHCGPRGVQPRFYPWNWQAQLGQSLPLNCASVHSESGSVFDTAGLYLFLKLWVDQNQWSRSLTVTFPLPSPWEPPQRGPFDPGQRVAAWGYITGARRRSLAVGLYYIIRVFKTARAWLV